MFFFSRLKHKILRILEREQHHITPNLTRNQYLTLKSLKDKDLVYLPSDKGREFCVISQESYNNLAIEHLSNTDLYTPAHNITAARIENNINKTWSQICFKRNLPKQHRLNFITKYSKLPTFYHLIKTHKNSTHTQIRPIVSSVNGPLYKISWLISRLLKPLLSTFPAHVSSSNQVINRLNDLPHHLLKLYRYPFSLDVVSLYTSIPAHPAINLMADIIASKNPQCFGITPGDLLQLLRIIVDNTYFTFLQNTFKQVSGLPMGSSLSGILAIAYMDKLERHTLSTCYSYLLFTRYIDDILIITYSREEAINIFHKFNNADPNLKFTIEHPDSSESLSLLDFKIQIKKNGAICTEFYRKPASKRLFVHFKSALPLKDKLNYAHAEISRIQDKCTNISDKHTHTNNFLQTLSLNGYPNTILSSLKKKKRNTRPFSNNCFLKLPFLSDKISSSIRKAIRSEGLNIQLIHTGSTLRQQLNRKHPSHTPSPCSLSNCPISHTGLCFKNHVVYDLQCAKCSASYIGSTTRLLHHRIKEHLNTTASSFYKHIRTCINSEPDFHINILASSRNVGQLRILESLIISKNTPTLNNRLELSSAFII